MKNMITVVSSRRALFPFLLLCLLVAESTSLAKSGKETKCSDSERVPLRQCNTLTLPFRLMPTLDDTFETQRLDSHEQSPLHQPWLVSHSLHVFAAAEQCGVQHTAPRNNIYWSKQVSSKEHISD